MTIQLTPATELFIENDLTMGHSHRREIVGLAETDEGVVASTVTDYEGYDPDERFHAVRFTYTHDGYRVPSLIGTFGQYAEAVAALAE